MIPVAHYERVHRDVMHIGRMGQYAWLLMVVMLLVGLTVILVSPDARVDPWRAAPAFGMVAAIGAVYFGISVAAMRLSRLYAAFSAILGFGCLYIAMRVAPGIFSGLMSAESPVFVAFAVFWILYVYGAIAVVIAAYRIAVADRDTRRVMSDLPPDLPFSLGIVPRTLGIPTSLRNVGRNRATVVALFFMASLGYAVIAIGFFLLIGALPLAASALEARFTAPEPGIEAFEEEAAGARPGEDDEFDEAMPDDFEPSEQSSPAVFLLSLLGAVGFAIPFASATRAAGRRLARSSIKSVQELDGRPPILFLRAFGDDQVELPKARQRLIAAPFTFGHRKTTLDVMLLEEGTDYGPVVALGNPQDPIPPYGAARGYFKDEDWQAGVERLASDSQAVVICVDDTDGVWWEVDLIKRREMTEKTLFLIHPRFKDPKANQSFCEALCDSLSLGHAARQSLVADARDPVLGFYFEAGRILVARSPSFSTTAYLLLLRAFQRNKLRISS